MTDDTIPDYIRQLLHESTMAERAAFLSQFHSSQAGQREHHPERRATDVALAAEQAAIAASRSVQ